MIFKRRPRKALSAEDKAFLVELKEILGFSPNDPTYYQRAFVHRSMNLKDEKGAPVNYERLEFLGDAMIGVIISKHLFKEVPTGDEGYLTKMRSKIVSRVHLNELGKELSLGDQRRRNHSARHASTQYRQTARHAHCHPGREYFRLH